MSEPNSVIPTSREVIENKLLTALEDDNTVAVLFSKQDLEDVLFALESYKWNPERIARCRELAGGMNQLYLEAFGEKSTP